MKPKFISLCYGDAPVHKNDGVDVEYVFINNIKSTNNRFVIAGDSSEFEYILDRIINNVDEELIIYRDNCECLFPNKEIPIETYECGTDKIFYVNIATAVPISEYYQPFIPNPVINHKLYPTYKGYADKMSMVPESWDKVSYSIEIIAMVLSRDTCNKIRSAYYKLHQNGYNLTRFAKATWYPLATLFPILLDWSKSHG